MQDSQSQDEFDEKGEAQKITRGINRIRFLKNKISQPTNPLYRLIETMRCHPISHQTQKPRPFVFLSSKNLERRPLSELREAKAGRTGNVEIVQRVKNEKRKWEEEIKRKRNEEKVDKMMKCRSRRREKEKGRKKISCLLLNKVNMVKQGRRIQYENNLSKTNNRIENYQREILLADKLRECIEQAIQFSNQ